LPDFTHGSSGRHQPLWTMTSSPTLTLRHVLADRPHDAEQSLPPAWKVLGLTGFLPLGDDVERIAECRHTLL